MDLREAAIRKTQVRRGRMHWILNAGFFEVWNVT
jgi:hypothetical protein